MCIFDCRRHNTIIKDVFIDAKPSSIISGTSRFKNAPISRFRESIDLILHRENGSIF